MVSGQWALAAVVHQLRKADRFHHRRTELAGLYTALWSEVEDLILPETQPDRIHSRHLFVIGLRLDQG